MKATSYWICQCDKYNIRPPNFSSCPVCRSEKTDSKMATIEDIEAQFNEQILEEKERLGILSLYSEYRKLVEKGRHESKKAQRIKAKILEYESINSRFMQEMNFLIDLVASNKIPDLNGDL